MLNLSDKELDRLSREAAQEFDPGDISGARGWEKLEVHLDRDLGKVSPNPMRSFRRWPFFYAPAILLILGVTYYLARQNKTGRAEPSGSPPLTVLQAPVEPATAHDAASNNLSSPNNSEHRDNSTSAPDKKTLTTPNGDGSAASGQPATANGSSAQPAAAGARSSLPAATNGSSRQPTATADREVVATNPAKNGSINHRTAGGNTNSTALSLGEPSGQTIAQPTGQATTTGNNRTDRNHTGANRTSSNRIAGPDATHSRELSLSSVRHARSMKGSPAISDSLLRAYTAKAGPIQPKKGVLRINKSLQLGLAIAPDFSSVNSLAGDKPGSSFGLTVDYQFANRWYLSTGLLATRKNYAARTEDYHVPRDYYRDNNLHNVDFVKGSFYMLEVPLNLRYDFSVAGNTVFFASGGLSSYLFTNENCNYYYNFFGRETARGFKYPNHNNYLFSAANLSLGVEAGISNSFSVLVAPYMKIPTRNVGFGQVQMSSVGINFALKFTPVLSRKRR